MENTTKKTKMEQYQMMKTIIANSDNEARNELIEVLDKEIEALEKRKVAARARAEQKKAESDELTDEIFTYVTDEAQTVEDILSNFDSEDITRNKITSRLGKLVKAGLVVKQVVKIDGNRKMAYCRVKSVSAPNA